ncbi:MAG: hypothetical protein Q9215_004410 [Flavoplaca cf. flavocitrina]
MESSISISEKHKQYGAPFTAFKEQIDIARRVLTREATLALSHLNKVVRKCRTLGDDFNGDNIDDIVKTGRKSVDTLATLFEKCSTVLRELEEFETQGLGSITTKTEERLFSKVIHLNRRIQDLNRRIKEEQVRTTKQSEEIDAWVIVDTKQLAQIKTLEDKVASQDLEIQEHLRDIQKLQQDSAAKGSAHKVLQQRQDKETPKIYDDGQAEPGAGDPGGPSNQAGYNREGLENLEEYTGNPCNDAAVHSQRKRVGRSRSPHAIQKPAKRHKAKAARLGPQYVQDAPVPSSSRLPIPPNIVVDDSADSSGDEMVDHNTEPEPSTDGEIPLGSEDNAALHGRTLDQRFSARQSPHLSTQPQTNNSTPGRNQNRAEARGCIRTTTIRAGELANKGKQRTTAGGPERPPLRPENINPDPEPWIPIGQLRHPAYTYDPIPPILFDRVRQQMKVWDGKKGPDAAGGSWREGAKGRSKGEVKCANSFANHDGSDMKLGYACGKCQERGLVCVGVLRDEVQIQPLLPTERLGASKADMAYWVRES